MSKVAGGLVFLAGIGGLGAWATLDHAKDIEAKVQAQAADRIASAQPGVDVSVSGRDIVVAGQVPSEAVASDLLAIAAAVPGNRDVRSAFTVLPAVRPFVTTLTRNADGTYDVEGAIPSEDIRAFIESSTGASGTDGLTLASGSPEGYTDALTEGVTALSMMETGTLRIEDGVVSLLGDAQSADAHASVTSALAQLPAALSVTNSVEFMPTAAPFTLTVDKDEDGALRLSGVLPPEVDAELLGQSMKADVSGITAARGAPEGFLGAVMASLGAVSQLDSGTLEISDTSVQLTGAAADQTTAEAIAATALPDGFDFQSDLEFTPSADPFTLNIERDAEGALTASGFVPNDDIRAQLEQVSGADLSGLTVANGAPNGWADAVEEGLAGLNRLDRGTLSLNGAEMTLGGSAPDEATFDDIAARLDALDGDVVARTSIIFPVTEIFPPTVVPYTFSATKGTNGQIAASGYAPSEAEIDALGLAGIEVAAGAPDGWTPAVDAGLQSLGQLMSGTLVVEGTSLQLTGTAPDEEAATAIADTLARVEGFDVTRDITVPTIVTSLDMSARYERATGLIVSGVAPEGLSAVGVADALGAATVDGNLTSDAGADPSAVEGPLRALGVHLEAVAEAEVTWSNGDVTLSGVVDDAADLDAITSDLEQSGLFASISLVRLPQAFAEGDTRPNPVSGIMETFVNGAWVISPEPEPEPELIPEPVPEPEPVVVTLSAEECQARTSAILAGNSVNFVTGGSELDRVSLGVIAELALEVTACFESNPRLTIIVEGHTDDTGSAVENIRLSDERATVVRQVMLNLGVSQFRVRAIGFGEERPIADNATQEGRAQNRRTVLVWNR